MTINQTGKYVVSKQNTESQNATLVEPVSAIVAPTSILLSDNTQYLTATDDNNTIFTNYSSLMDGIFTSYTFPYDDLGTSWEMAFVNFEQLSIQAIKDFLNSLPPAQAGDDNDFLNVDFTKLFDIPVNPSLEQGNNTSQVSSSGAVESDLLNLSFQIGLNQGTYSVFSVQSVPETLTITNNTTPPLSILTPTIPIPNVPFPNTPSISYEPSFLAANQTFVLPSPSIPETSEYYLNSYNKIVIQGNILDQTFGFSLPGGPASGGGAGIVSINASFSSTNIAGGTETYPIAGEIVLTTTQGNTFTFFTASVAGHQEGDYFYTLNNPILIPPNVTTNYTVDVTTYAAFLDQFLYSVTNSDNQTGVGTIAFPVLVDPPVAFDQSGPTASEADIKDIGSAGLNVVEKLAGSLVGPLSPSGTLLVSPSQTSNPTVLPANESYFGHDGGFVSSVTFNGIANATSGTPILNDAAITITAADAAFINHSGFNATNGFTNSAAGDQGLEVVDFKGNELIVDAQTGGYIYELVSPFTNTAEATANPETNLPATESFNFVFSNSLNQSTSGNILTITINDDAPLANNGAGTVFEAGLAAGSHPGDVADPTVATGTLNDTFGADGPSATVNPISISLSTIGADNTGAASAVTTSIAVSGNPYGFAAGDTIETTHDGLGNTFEIDTSNFKYAFILSNPVNFTAAQAVENYSLILNDSDGSTSSPTNVAITINYDPPVMSGAANTVGYIEHDGTGVATAIDNSLTINDVSPTETLAGATITIGNNALLSSDVLNFAAQNNITETSFVSGVLTLSGIDTLADYQAALRSITYSSTSADPTNAGTDLTRTISWQVQDDNNITPNNLSNVITSTVDVALVNDQAIPNNTTTTNPLNFVATDYTLYTDQTLTGATGTLLAGDQNPSGDTLTVVPVATGTSTDNGSYTLNSDGSFTYTPPAIAPVTPDQFTFGVNDGFSNQVTATASITINQSTIGVSGSDSVTNTTGTVSDGNTYVSLAHSDSGNTADTLEVASYAILTFDSSGNIINTGSFQAIPSVGTADIVALADGSITLDPNGSYSYTATANTGGTYDGVELEFTDITHSNSVVVSGDAAIKIYNQAVAPTLTAGNTDEYLLELAPSTAPSAVVDSALSLSDSNATPNLSATVQITGGLFAGDQLNFTNQNGITGTYNPVNGELTLSGNATLAQYQAALQSITYSSTAPEADPTDDGTDNTRTISWILTDTQQGTPYISNTGTSTIDVFLTVTGTDAGVSVTGDTITTSSNSMVLNGAGETLNVTGGSNQITDNGSTNTINVNGDSNTVNATNDTITLTGTSESLSVTGSSNQITDNGSSNTINVNGSNTVTLGASDSVNLGGSDSETLTLNGITGLTINVNTNLDTINSNANIINLIGGGGETLTVIGDNNTINASGTMSDYDNIIFSGTGNVANGMYDNVTDPGSNETVNISNSIISISSNNSVVNGNNDTINFFGSGQALAINGANNIIALEDSNQSVAINTLNGVDIITNFSQAAGDKISSASANHAAFVDIIQDGVTVAVAAIFNQAGSNAGTALQAAINSYTASDTDTGLLLLQDVATFIGNGGLATGGLILQGLTSIPGLAVNLSAKGPTLHTPDVLSSANHIDFSKLPDTSHTVAPTLSATPSTVVWTASHEAAAFNVTTVHNTGEHLMPPLHHEIHH